MSDLRRLADELDEQASTLSMIMPTRPKLDEHVFLLRQQALALRSAADENDRLREALGDVHTLGCRKYAASTGRWEFCIVECADARRALLAVPELCPECGDTKWVKARPLSPGRPCPVCAVPTEEA